MTSRRNFCLAAAGGVANLFGLSGVPPNILVLKADDMGLGDPSCYASKKVRTKYPTKNIDRLAERGVRFTSCYAGASVCSPSRASFMTGEMYLRTGVDEVLLENSKKSLASTVVTIPQALTGHKSLFCGKWHLGYDKNPLNYPLAKGFNEAVWNPYSPNMTPLPLLRGDKVVVENVTNPGSLTKTFTNETLAFIKASKDRPFYAHLAYTTPHYPLLPPDKFKDKTDSVYRNVIYELDESVGQIIGLLESEGLLSNTLVVFTSDNGPIPGYGSTGPFQGFKFGIGEGSFRVPGIVSWPDKIPQGRVCHAPIAHMDFLPTIASAAGASVSKKIDGMDLGPMLWGGEKWNEGEFADRLIPYCSGRGISAVRWHEWKLVFAGDASFSSPKLYNVDITPDESTDVSSGHPEVVSSIMGKYRILADTLWPGKLEPD